MALVLWNVPRQNRQAGTHSTLQLPNPPVIPQGDTRELVIKLNMRAQDIQRVGLRIVCRAFIREIGTTDWVLYNQAELIFPAVLDPGEVPNFNMGRCNEWNWGREVGFEFDLNQSEQIGGSLELIP